MGLIRNSNQVKQAIDFQGFENGLIHPSDIDAVLEFDNKVLILIEVKRKGIVIPVGQRLLLERICDAWHNNDRVGIILLVEHTVFDDTIDIPLSEGIVTSTYYFGKWYNSENPIPLPLLNGENWADMKKPMPLIDVLNALGKYFGIEHKLNLK